MSKKYLIIGGIVIGIVIIIMLLTYIIINNGIFRFNSSESSNVNTNQDPINSNLPTEESIADIEKDQGSGDYYYWSMMPIKLQSKLPNPRTSSALDYYYSKELGIAFSYEVISLIDKEKFIAVTPPENGGTVNTVYLHHFNEAKELGQYIEIIDIEDNLRFSNIPEIINSQILDDKQKQVCKIEEKNNRYSIIAKDTKVKDSTLICGKYASMNRFFIKPIHEEQSIKKLLFVNTGDKEWSYDGTMQGKYWYESVIVE